MPQTPIKPFSEKGKLWFPCYVSRTFFQEKLSGVGRKLWFFPMKHKVVAFRQTLLLPDLLKSASSFFALRNYVYRKDKGNRIIACCTIIILAFFWSAHITKVHAFNSFFKLILNFDKEDAVYS